MPKVVAIIFSIRNLEMIKTVNKVKILTKNIQSVFSPKPKCVKANCIKKEKDIRFTINNKTLKPLNKCELSLYILVYLSEISNLKKSLKRLSNADFAITITTNESKKISAAQSLFSIILGCNSSAIIVGKITKFYLLISIIILLRL